MAGFAQRSLVLACVLATASATAETRVLESFSKPAGAKAGTSHNAAGRITHGDPVISVDDGSSGTSHGCAVFRVDTTDGAGSHGQAVIPVPPTDVSRFRYVRLWLKMPAGAFFRLGATDHEHTTMIFDGFWSTAGNVHYAGPWGTYEAAATDRWTAYEIDLDHTVDPFDRGTAKLAGVCIEIYGPGYPLSVWAAKKGRFSVKVDDIAVATESLTPSANAPPPKIRRNRKLPLLVGGEAHGAKTIRILQDLGLGNFTWIPSSNYVMGNEPWDHKHTLLDDVAECVAAKRYFFVSGRRGLGDRFRAGGFNSGGHGSGEWRRPATISEVMAKGGKYFVGLLAEEMDADLIQENCRPAFRARLPRVFSYTDAAGGRRNFERELRRIKDRYHALGAPFLPSLCITHHHSGFRIGADAVVAELLEHLPTTELQLAYLRGGSQQFGQDWGVWISPWYKGTVPCADKELWPAPQAKPGGGHPPSMFRRALCLSYVSGARLLLPQNTEPLYARDGRGGYKTVLWGTELASFWQYARKHDRPFEPIVPLAVLMDKDNGWEPPFLWGTSRPVDTVWSILSPDRYRDGMFREYLNVLLPGFTRTEAGVKVPGRDVFPGYFAATPAGPFDIVASDVTAERLAKYPSVALLGGINMTPGLLANLRTYVHDGGTLLVNALQMYDGPMLRQDKELLGAVIEPAITPASTVKRTGEVPGVTDKTVAEKQWFAVVHAKPSTAKVLAVDGNGGRWPILLCNAFGKGRVFLSTPEFMLAGYAKDVAPLGFFARLLRGLAQSGPVRVAASREVVSWVAAYQGRDEAVVLLTNHDKKPVDVGVVWSGPFRSSTVDVGDATVAVSRTEKAADLSVRVPGEDVILIRLKLQTGANGSVP